MLKYFVEIHLVGILWLAFQRTREMARRDRLIDADKVHQLRCLRMNEKSSKKKISDFGNHLIFESPENALPSLTLAIPATRCQDRLTPNMLKTFDVECQ